MNRKRRCKGRAWVVSLVLLLALAGCQAAAREEAAPDTEANIAVVEAYADVWSSGEVDRLDELFTEDWAYHASGGPDMDRTAYKEYIASSRAAFPDLQFTTELVFAAGDMVSKRMVFTGTHQGTYMDIPATGNPVRVEGIALFRLVDGKIAEQWAVFDSLSMLEQLGVELTPPKTVKTGAIKGRPLTRCGTDPLSYSYDLYVPTTYDPAESYALVINLHGLDGTPTGQEMLSRMTKVAEEEAFIVAAPAATAKSWNAGACCGLAMAKGIDDVAFVSDLIDAVSAEYHVDSRRVFATGMSNGAKMAHRLACDLSGRIAAIAPVSGGLVLEQCEPARPVAVLYFHGTADPISPFLGGYTGIVNTPALVTIERWADINGCSEETEVVYQEGEVTCTAHMDCEDGATVTLCKVEGGGHTWPGGMRMPEEGAGHTTYDIDASRYMWEFFKAHPMP